MLTARLSAAALLLATLVAALVAAPVAQSDDRPAGSATGAAGADALPVVSSVRVGNHGAITRFVMHLSRPIRYRAFTLANPYRVVIDMPLVYWQLAQETRLGQQGTISAFRFGNFSSSTTRVVLDVDDPVAIHRVFALRPRGNIRTWRLVLDLKTVTEDEFERLARQNRTESRGGRTNGRNAVGQDVRQRAERERRKRIIVLDPGHGGVDPGAMSPNGLREKDVVLRVARAIARELEASERFSTILTRNDDNYIPLRRRYQVARRQDAALFISLHADSHPGRNTRGLSVYTLSERSSDAEAEALARRENLSDAIAGVDLSERSDQVAGILIDLAQRETMNQSARFAETLLGELRGTIDLLSHAHRYAGFAVLKAPDVPSVLVELGYLTNSRDERLLKDEDYHRRLARSVVSAIDKYFDYRDRIEGRTRAQRN